MASSFEKNDILIKSFIQTLYYRFIGEMDSVVLARKEAVHGICTNFIRSYFLGGEKKLPT